MTSDNRTNEPSEAQVEAAAKAMHERDLAKSEELYPNRPSMWAKLRPAYYEHARAALVAAQGAAPQAAKDVHEPNHDRVYCVRCGGNWPCQPAPVLPSSNVQESPGIENLADQISITVLQSSTVDADRIEPGDYILGGVYHRVTDDGYICSVPTVAVSSEMWGDLEARFGPAERVVKGPVLHVDEDALAKFIRSEFQRWWDDEPGTDEELGPFLACAVAGWLKEQRRG